MGITENLKRASKQRDELIATDLLITARSSSRSNEKFSDHYRTNMMRVKPSQWKGGLLNAGPQVGFGNDLTS